MKTVNAFLLGTVITLGGIACIEYQTIISQASELTSLRTAKATLLKDVNETNRKFGEADLARQISEAAFEKWQKESTYLYTPAILRQLKPVPLPDGTSKVVWPNPYDLPKLVEAYCTARR